MSAVLPEELLTALVSVSEQLLLAWYIEFIDGGVSLGA